MIPATFGVTPSTGWGRRIARIVGDWTYGRIGSTGYRGRKRGRTIHPQAHPVGMAHRAPRPPHRDGR